jgi:hypothetical protein
MPAPQAFNYYINWAIYAVYGKMGEADGLMRPYGSSIRSVAKHLVQQLGAPVGRLYRGVLLEPEELAAGQLAQDPRLTFVSFSEDRDVACWFADRQSIVSGFVAQMRPGVVGYVVEYDARPSEVLFHWRWADRIKLPDGRVIRLAAVAAAHPDIEDPRQVVWNLASQHEVILRPLRNGVPVTAYELTDCPPTAELDARFAMPT